MKTNITNRFNAILSGNKRSAIIFAALITTVSFFSSCKKTETPAPAAPSAPVVKYGTIHYTLTNYAGTHTKDEELTAASNCSIGAQSAICFQNKSDNFRIGVIASGALTKDATYCLDGSAGSTANAYSTAKYNWFDVHSGKSYAMPFQEGQSIVTDYRPSDKVVKVYFSYSLADPDHNNEPVTVSGYAVINNIIK